VDPDPHVVDVDLRRPTHTHLLHLRRLARRPALLLFLGLLVLELAVVHDLADRRAGVGGDLDEVEPGLVGQAHRLGRLDDADLLVVGADDADRADPDHVVDAGAPGSGLVAERWTIDGSGLLTRIQDRGPAWPGRKHRPGPATA